MAYLREGHLLRFGKAVLFPGIRLAFPKLLNSQKTLGRLEPTRNNQVEYGVFEVKIARVIRGAAYGLALESEVPFRDGHCQPADRNCDYLTAHCGFNRDALGWRSSRGCYAISSERNQDNKYQPLYSTHRIS